MSLFPDTCTITRPGEVLTVDSEFGQPVAEVSDTVIYKGACRVSGDALRIRQYLTGGGRLDVDTPVYLPQGDHGVAYDDVLTVDGHGGRIKSVAHFTERFYTRLLVKWADVP